MPDKIRKFLDSLDNKLRAKLKTRLQALKENPWKGPDIKKLKVQKSNLYRLRVGKIRIIYEIAGKDIEVIDIDYRGNIY